MKQESQVKKEPHGKEIDELHLRACVRIYTWNEKKWEKKIFQVNRTIC